MAVFAQMFLMVKVCKPPSTNMFLSAFLMYNDLMVQHSDTSASAFMKIDDLKITAT